MVPCGSGARVAVPFPARGITRTFDVRTGKQLAEVPGGRPLFDPQGSVLVTARDQRPGETRHWWDAATGELLWESPGAVLAFSADGTRALLTAPGAARTVLTVREARTGKVIAEFPPCADPRVGRFSLDGNRIVTHHASGRIAVRDVATCAVVWESAAFAGTVKELRYDPRAERVVALTDTGLVGGDVSDESGKLESVTLERGRGRITERLAPDGSRLVDAKGGLYDTRTGARIMGLALQTSECCPGGLAWSSDGTRLGALDFHMNTGDGLSVLAPLNGQRRVIDLRGHDKVDNFDYPLNKGTVRTAMFEPRGATVLTASADGTARLWDARTGAELHAMDVGRSVREPVAFARFSKDGTLIITGQDQSAQIKVWDAASGKLVAAMAHPQGFMVNGRNADFSTDGTRVKCRNTTAQPPQVSIHEARSGALLYWAEGNKVRFVKPGHERADAEFQQHSEEPRVSPDGRDRLLVTGSTVLVVDNRPDAALRSLDAWMSPEGRAQWHWQHGMSGDKFAGDFHRMQARVARCEAAVLACFRMIGVRVDARRLLAFARPAQEWLPGDRRAVAWTRWSYAGGYFEYDGAGRWIEADRNGRRAFREQAATEEYVEIFDDSRDIGVRLYWDRMTLKQPRATEYVRFRPGAWEQTVARIFRAPPPRLVEH
jgi:WD40 repeat protein